MSEQRFTNRLIHETSPYLLQHAHNPVDWYPWGEEALRRAQAEDRPIFLSIGYSACHWCHVMEHESFEDEQIAALMNEHFVNIKVDREERPDLDEIYMHAVQAMTGSGGWPMSVFLTPDLEPFYGGTYFPPDDRYGRPGFAKVLLSVAQYYRTRKEEAKGHAGRLRGYLEQMASLRSREGGLGPDLLESAYRRLAGQFDHANGGFGGAPKFPGSMSLAFFLRYHRRAKAASALEMAAHACRKMACGGIYDQIGGGFHRYSVDERWLVPHFEKMLYDNALLSQLYLEVFQATGDAFFRRVVEETLDYVIREMEQPEGGFYSTQDADSEGEEGKFFVWTPEEVEQVLGEEKGEVFCRYFDITPHGNFEHGRSVLNVPVPMEGIAKLFRMEAEAVREIVEEGRRRLFEAREGRVRPGRDDKVQTSWNGLMLSSFARACAVLGESRYRIVAERAAAFILDRLLKDGRLLHTYKDGRARFNGYLDDYSFFVCGLIDLYEATFDAGWLRRALDLTGVMLEQFWDEADGGFFFTGRDHERLLVRSRNPYDNAIPSGNSAAAHAFLRLSALTGREDLRERGGRALQVFRDFMAEAPGGFAHALCALDFYLERPKEIALVGRREGEDTKRLLATVHGRFLPNKVVCLLDPADGTGAGDLTPLLKGKTQKGGRATAYVCRDFACSAPVTEPGELEALLEG
jgi:uncharacterized protein YyaL (SSP411 family)